MLNSASLLERANVRVEAWVGRSGEAALRLVGRRYAVLGTRFRQLVCALAPLLLVEWSLGQGDVARAQMAGHAAVSYAARADAAPGSQAPDYLADPGRALPAGWRASPDRALAVAGDATGLHVLVADASDAYAWRTVATLSVRGTDTTQWIGQGCLTGSGERAVVVYAPRQITNAPEALGFGAVAAVVNLSTGQVTQLGAGASIAYFDPGCGTGQEAVLTQGGTGESPLPGPADTRLLMLDALTGKIIWTVTVAGQVTSAVPYDGQVAAVTARGVVRISRRGTVHLLSAVPGQAYGLAPDSRGGLAFLVAAGNRVQVRRYASGRTQLMGSAALGSLELTQIGGRVFVTGEHATELGRLPSAWRALDVPAGSDVSSTGMLAVSLANAEVYTQGKSPLTASPQAAQPVQITGLVPATGEHVSFTVPASFSSAGSVLPAKLPGFPGAPRPRPAAAQDSGGVGPPPSNVDPATTTYDPDRSCSVPRNDPSIQTYQPSAEQVEWAADEAVRNDLTADEPANLYGSGMPAYSPQGLFRAPGLAGGGSVPVQVLLGIMAQESNEDQASDHAIIGQTGNFEPSYDWYGDLGDYTYVDFAASDCGYGIAQVTTGMCRSGYSGCTKPLPYENQLAIAIDYESNIAAGLQILEQKWNQLYKLGIKVNGGNPVYVEDWWFALWDYNSGLEPNAANGNTTGCSPSPTCTDKPGNGPGGNWGLGWVDNPANPMYPPDRPMFLERGPRGSVYSYNYDEAHPAGWSYEEKVIGFAAYGFYPYNYVKGANELAFAQTRYASGASPAQPPITEFCAAKGKDDNHCDPTDAGKSSACQLSDDHCWWHEPITWENCDDLCGVQVLAYAAKAANPGDPGVPPGYAPDCSRGPVPASAVIVGDTASSIPRPLGCGTSWINNGGTMTWTFATAGGTPATYPSKIDFHQIGGGYSGHYWFTHSIASDQPSATAPISNVPSQLDSELEVTGQWTPPRSVTGWTKIMVAIPDEGAWDPQANYLINLGNGTIQSRIVNQAFQVDTWVPLGIFDLHAGANVTLNNVTLSGLGYDVAWDAMAFIPSGPPGTDYVALGDSYSSGEGLQPFDRNSDYDYDGMRDACHRSGSYGSGQAYSQLVKLPGQSETIAQQASSPTSATQYTFLACSGDVSTELAVQAYDNGADGSQYIGGGTVAQAPMANTAWDTFSLGYNELPQASTGWLGPQTTLVTLTVGGDDARFISVFKGCLLTLHACTGKHFYLKVNGKRDPEPLFEYEPKVIAALQPHLEAVYTEIARLAPNAEIIVLGYPRLFPGNTNAPVCWVDAVVRLAASTTSWMNKTGNELNTTTSNAVAAVAREGYNVHFINPTPGFTGHEICSSDPWINGVITESESGSNGGKPQFPGAGSFHPKAAGQKEYAKLVNECLAGTISC
jgi:hypothetical protein